MIKLQAKLQYSIIILSILTTGNVQSSQSVDFDEPTGYFESNSLHEKYDQKLTFDQYVTYSIKSLAQVAGWDNDLHRYDSKQDLLDSFENLPNLNLSTLADSFSALRQEASANDKPTTARRIDSSELDLFSDEAEIKIFENDMNQEECSRQLDQLIEMVLKLFRNFDSYSSSRQLSLIDFLDSYGSAPSEQLLMGNHVWLGSHSQCLSAKIQHSTQAPISGRYCVAKLRSPNWPTQPNGATMAVHRPSLGDQSIKLGVCLPRVCNSISILRHSNKLETLIKLARLQQVPFSSYKLQNIFCLPDESSPLRQFSASARTFIACLTAWLVFLLYFSAKYELILARARGVKLDERQLSKWVKIFALRYSWRSLFSSNSNSSAASEFSMTHISASSKTAPADKCADSSVRPPKVNLNVVEGIKVMSMIWLISAHTMLFFLRTITNGRNFWSIIMDVRFMTIMAGIFPVDSFFTVTGFLTAYLKLNKDNGQAIKHPRYWLEAFVHRYLRFMPMYLVVFWYTRDMSQYTGQGPLWDYATANTSLRSVCKQESFTVPLMFQANFKPIDQHCVKPAWYLANDYQYLLITPLYLGLIMCSRCLGYGAILLTLALSLLSQFYTVYNEQKFTDFEGLINFRPMFATYVLKDLWQLYTLPYNRIAPYLIGILTGHLMHARTNTKRAQSESKSGATRQKSDKDDKRSSNDEHQSHQHPHQLLIFNADGAQPPIASASAKQCIPNNAKFITSANAGQLNYSPASLVSGSMDIGNNNQRHNESVDKKPSNPITSAPTLAIKQVHFAKEKFFQTSVEHGEKIDITSELGNFFKRHLCMKIWTPVILLISIIYLPLLTKLNKQEGEHARIGASLIIALMRFFWSIAIARLIYVCCCNSIASNDESNTNCESEKTSSFIIGLLESPMWKPWSKIGLSVLLIQWEIIGYLAQMQTTPPFMSISYMLAVMFTAIVGSYLIGLIIYLTVEFPLSQIEHYHIHPRLFGKKL